MSDLAAFMKGRSRIAGLPETRNIFDRCRNATSSSKSPAPSSICASTTSSIATSSRRTCCSTHLQPTCSNTSSWRRFLVTVPSCGMLSNPRTCSLSPAALTRRSSTPGPCFRSWQQHQKGRPRDDTNVIIAFPHRCGRGPYSK
jgi:hypothetical protein